MNLLNTLMNAAQAQAQAQAPQAQAQAPQAQAQAPQAQEQAPQVQEQEQAQADKYADCIEHFLDVATEPAVDTPKIEDLPIRKCHKTTVTKKCNTGLKSTKVSENTKSDTNEICPEWVDSKEFLSLQDFVKLLQANFVGDDMILAGVASLAGIVAQQNVMLTGSAGTGKSMLARFMGQLLSGAKSSFIQFSEHTPTEDVLGSVDMLAMDSNVYKRDLSKANIATNFLFCDEIEKASEAIHHAMLSLLAEREIYNGGQRHTLNNLELLIATRNFHIEDPAMADRFSICVNMSDIAPIDMLKSFSRLTNVEITDKFSKSQIEWFRGAAEHAFNSLMLDMKNGFATPVCKAILQILTHKELEAIMSRTRQRKTIQMFKVIAAWAAIHGRDKINVADLWSMHLAYLDNADQLRVKHCIEQTLTIVKTNDPRTPYPYPTIVASQSASDMLKNHTNMNQKMASL